MLAVAGILIPGVRPCPRLLILISALQLHTATLQSGGANPKVCSQVFNAVGLLNLPDWYNAGRVAQLNSFAPFSERRPSHCKQPAGPAAVSAVLLPALPWRCPACWSSEGDVDAPAGTLLAVQLFLFGWVESKRWVDFFKPKSQAEPGTFLGFEPYLGGTGQNGYPGGPIFDPLGFSKCAPCVRNSIERTPGWTLGACLCSFLSVGIAVTGPCHELLQDSGPVG